MALAIVFLVGFATVSTWILTDLFGITRSAGSPSAGTVQLGITLAVAVIVLTGASRVARRLSAPVDDLLDAADRLAAGDYDVRVAERGPRDLRAAARALNTLAERLADTELRRRALFADVSHELRTPLTVVRGGLEGMLDGVRPRDDEHIGALRDETLLLDRLIDDLRTVALAEVGALALHREDVAPADVVDAAVAAFRAGADAAGVHLVGHAAERLPAISADPVRLGEILRNLLANALRATPAGGEVEATASAADAGSVAFTVRDTGAGLAPGEAERIFDRYHRASDSTGSGLGLTIARELVAAHGGTIAAASDGPGRGTTVRFTIPAAG